MSRTTQSFTFLAPTLAELVDADDVPARSEGWYPFQIRRVSRELVSEVDYLVNAIFNSAKLLNGVRQIGRKVGVEQESHAD